MIARRSRFLIRSAMLATAALLGPLPGVDADRAFAQTVPAQPGLGLQEQGAPTPRQDGPAPGGAAPAAKENPGLINEMGKLFDRIAPNIKSPGETLDELNTRARDAAKGAGDALSRLTNTGSMVAGRAICPLADSGTPDCKLGADRLCQSKGFKEGKSLSTDSAQSCSAKVLIRGRACKPDDCRTDNYVTTALCQ
jgi:hypothetical protein